MADRDANTAYWPASVWAGRSPTRTTPNAVHRSPDAEDWEQLIKEMDAVQGFVSDIIGEALLDAENVIVAETAIVAGQALILADAGEVDFATNDGTVAAASFVGLALEGIAFGETGQIQTAGIVDLTAAEWDAVTGGSGGLTPGAWYFVGAAGDLVSAVPTGGDIIAPVGQALTATKLLLDKSYPVASS